MCASLGLHWVALQTLAWSQMLVSFSRHTTITAAVKMTFDGDHPCGLCQIVKKGRSEQQQHNGYTHRLVKWEAVIPPVTPLLVLREHECSYPTPIIHAFSRVDRPPTPPPRIRRQQIGAVFLIA